MVTEDRHDRDFLARYCTGFDAFQRYLIGEDDGVAKTPEWAAAICGVPADTIRDLARRAAGLRSMITCAWSLQRAHHGEQPYWAAITLAAMLGGIGLPGGGFAFGHGSINGVGVPRADLPGPDASRRRSIRRGSPFRSRALPTCCCIRGKLTISTAAAMSIRISGWSTGPAAIRSIIIRTSTACSRRGRSRKPIVVHESWWTPTARRADIVLPATTTLERNDVGGSSRDPYLFAMHQAIDPVGEARNDFDIFGALAERLGLRATPSPKAATRWAGASQIYDRVRNGAAR